LSEIQYRAIGPSELDRLGEIDRTEAIDHIYYMRNDELVLEEEHWHLTDWPPGHLDELININKSLLARGGSAWGAFDGDRLVGIASLDSEFIGRKGDTLNMAILHVSHGYRGRGIGTRLMEFTKERALELGAGRIYVSGMPTKRAVTFYMNRGCQLADEVDPELFEREPEDIHMIMDLRP
jgi:predicted N-acetyltransferase YhbS